MTPDEMREASREAEIAEWRESNRFCGRCGSEMKPHDDPGERALLCAKCGAAHVVPLAELRPLDQLVERYGL